MPINHISHMNFMRGQSVASGVRGPGSSMAGLAGLAPQANAQLNALLMNAAVFANNAEPRAAALHNSLTNMQQVIDRVSAVSSNTSAIRVREFSGGSVPQAEVDVTQTAAPQRNEGTALQANARVVPPGVYRFEIEADGRRREILLAVNEPLTNREFQQQMAAAVNNADLGINASVHTSNNQSTLRLVTAATGAAEDGGPRFTVRDISGNAVELTGIDNITQYARDAIFFVDGEERTSATNDVDLGGGLTVTLLSVTEETVTFSPGTNSSGMRNGLRDVVRQYNALLETARGNSTDNRTRALIRELESIARRNQRHLQEIGVFIGENGQLIIDEDMMQRASENGAIERVFGETGGLQSNFVSSLSRVANSVRNTPMRHISTSAARMPGFNAMRHAAANGNTLANEPPPSPFDAFNMNDLMGSWLNMLR